MIGLIIGLGIGAYLGAKFKIKVDEARTWMKTEWTKLVS